MLFHVFSTGHAQLHGDKLESLKFKLSDDFAGLSTLDGIGLEHDESAFSGHFVVFR